MFYIILWGFQWGSEKETFRNLILYVLYYFVRISVRFWKDDLKFDFSCIILLCEDFSEVLKKKLSKIGFLMFNFVLWGLQWGFEKEIFQNLISYVLNYFEKYTLLNLISYALYCFVRTSVRFWKRDFPKFDFLCLILLCEDFSEVFEKETFQNLIYFILYFLWGFQWGFEKETFQNWISYV